MSNQSKKKNIRIILLIILAAVIIGGYGVYRTFDRNLRQLSAVEIGDVDLNKTLDGTYIGSYSAFPVGAQVSVTILDHQISDITLLQHDHGQGIEAEVLPDHVMAVQSLQVDSISGATYSSKVILKAIEAALLKAVRP